MKKLIKPLFWGCAALCMLLVVVSAYIYWVLVPQLPSIEHLEDTQLQVPLRIYDRTGNLLAEYGEHRRIPVQFADVPAQLIQAFVAAEDHQFWEHGGVNPLALMAAVYQLATTGNKERGGSTITMQVARNFFLSPEKTYTRKLNEILLALKIEQELDKEKILELYLNKIYFGHRAYGIVAAAQVYYNKSLEDLSLAQSAMIAGLPKAPSKYNPIRRPRRALSRRDHILNQMQRLDYIDAEAFELALAEPVTAELHLPQITTDAQYVAELVRAQLFEQYGEDAYKIGLKAYTSIDGPLQSAANLALRRALLDYNRRHGYRGVIQSIDLTSIAEDPFDTGLISDEQIGNLQKAVVTAVDETTATALIANYQQIRIPFEKGLDWASVYLDANRRGKKPDNALSVLKVGDVIWVEHRAPDLWLLADVPKVEGALVSINAENGAVQALVGGFDFFKNKFNRATQAKRQPGSNFKPFIYSAALEKGFTAASIINDAPVVFDDDALESTWRPENYSGRFYGPTRLREALVKSRNLVSIRILQAIGLRHATQYAQRFGLDKANMPYDLSLALGSGTFTPLEIARAYAVFSNGGYLIKPFYLNRLETGNGEVIFEHNPVIACTDCDGDSEKPPVAKITGVAGPIETEAGKPKGQPLETDSAVPNEETADSDPDVEKPATLYAPQVITSQNAFIMGSMLREVVDRGTAVRAKALGRTDIGGKTGTTNDQVDAWFSGFNDKQVTTSWVGFDSQQTLGRGETGGRAALPMWMEYMAVALKNDPEALRKQPEELVAIRIDSATGKRASTGTISSRFEFFRLENAPAEQPVLQSVPNSRVEEHGVEDIF